MPARAISGALGHPAKMPFRKLSPSEPNQGLKTPRAIIPHGHNSPKVLPDRHQPPLRPGLQGHTCHPYCTSIMVPVSAGCCCPPTPPREHPLSLLVPPEEPLPWLGLREHPRGTPTPPWSPQPLAAPGTEQRQDGA